MPLQLRDIEARTAEAVRHYWRTLDAQAIRQTSRGADRGNRAAVTGGKQMDGFAQLVHQLLRENGVDGANIFLDTRLELPGYFRATKKWDMLVIRAGRLIAAMEFKSQRGPSFGNNLNNRTEEALGTSKDLWTAFRDGAFGSEALPPWLGWATLLEDCAGSTRPVGVSEPHFKVFPEFRDASYARRWEVMLRKLVLEKLYDATALLLSEDRKGRQGEYTEPATDLGMRRFVASLVGHAAALVAGEHRT